MPLKEILDANARFLATHQREEMPEGPRKKMAIVTCMDFRLTEFLAKAIGIGRGDAMMIRNAGNTHTTRDHSALRSLVAAILIFDIREILVIGHTGCGMRADTAVALDRIKDRGIRREDFGSTDLREWLGLIASEAGNVREMVRWLAASPLIPSAIEIQGFVLDTKSGKIEHVSGRSADMAPQPDPEISHEASPPVAAPPTPEPKASAPARSPKLRLRW